MSPRPGASPGRQYGWTLAGTVLAGVAMLFSLGRTWVTATAGGQGAPTVAAAITGRTLVPIAAGAAVLILAGLVGTVATRSWGRVICGALIAAAGGAAVLATAAFAFSASAIGAQAVEAELGLPGVEVVVHAWWPLVVLAGLLAACCGAVVALKGRSWPTMGSEYERSDSLAGAGQRTPAQAWDALDRGLDPTIDSDLTQ